MRKIPREYENFIDNVLIDTCDTVSGWFHSTGHTPNMITVYSAICGIIAIHSIYAENVRLFVCAATLHYFFDCLDGFMARKYHQETVFGDYFDHIKDLCVIIGIIYAMVVKYKEHTVNLKVLTVACSLIVLTMMHLACQQHYHSRRQSHKELLDKLKPMCNSPEYIQYTKWFGLGTVNFALVAFVAYTMKNY